VWEKKNACGNKKQLESIQEHHFHGGTEVRPYQPVAPSRIQTASTTGSSSYYENYVKQSEEIHYSMSTKNHLYRMQNNVRSDIVTSYIDYSPSDEAYITAMKKDEKKDSQLEVLATKWTRSVDLVIDKEVSEPSDSKNSSNCIRASPKLSKLLKDAVEESSFVEVIAVVICRLEGCKGTIELVRSFFEDSNTNRRDNVDETPRLKLVVSQFVWNHFSDLFSEEDQLLANDLIHQKVDNIDTVIVADEDDAYEVAKACKSCSKIFVGTKYWDKFDSNIEEKEVMTILKASYLNNISEIMFTCYECDDRDYEETKIYNNDDEGNYNSILVYGCIKNDRPPKFREMHQAIVYASTFGLNITHSLTLLHSNAGKFLHATYGLKKGLQVQVGNVNCMDGLTEYESVDDCSTLSSKSCTYLRQSII